MCFSIHRAKGLEVKVKVTLVQALRLCTGRTAHRRSRGIVLLFHDYGTRRGWGVSVTLRPFFTPGKTRYPLYRRMGGSQGRSGRVRKISPPPGFDPRTVQPVASRYTDWAIAAHANRLTLPINTSQGHLLNGKKRLWEFCIRVEKYSAFSLH